MAELDRSESNDGIGWEGTSRGLEEDESTNSGMIPVASRMMDRNGDDEDVLQLATTAGSPAFFAPELCGTGELSFYFFVHSLFAKLILTFRFRENRNEYPSLSILASTEKPSKHLVALPSFSTQLTTSSIPAIPTCNDSVSRHRPKPFHQSPP